MRKKRFQKTRAKAKVAIPIQTSYGRHLCEFIYDPQEKGYTVIAKHVPGVVTQGKTLREAERMAREALELCIEGLTAERFASRAEFRARERMLSSART
ncbi:MAG: hypothetical protein A3A44_00095 [Candidatus Sungbacteria bacterium RIFCSPLOWO2_01_FULL_60_25]|uniref:HicB-like antitoxin of toxin-antitoxin system domain-containing protein n=1 Tax=Candidatus Sungbacteria bacterium RIFCSPLOWO2_01_FULL_60_25 TaxID=1802281 RepID=A0A1G2LBD3_9BACT|nr:MAG: hypothetical protein A3A44_00095 [Candidatus Sungbacteria bacterium RIFCSPLOWO2_01_FULL_60_25]